MQREPRRQNRNDEPELHMLICKFASARSHPDRIRSWIRYLEDMRTAHSSDREATELLDRLLRQARVWPVQRLEREREAAPLVG